MSLAERNSFTLKVAKGVCMLLACPFLLISQIDSVQRLRQIEVTAERIDLTDIGKHTDKLDSQFLHVRHYDQLASMLAHSTPLFVRSYGGGTLATLGIRGGSASHTQILWNGIPIRNPMLGLIDLALLPTAFIDEAAVHYGGHGAAFGSGAIGGLISLSNDKVNPSDRIILQTGFGSWGKREGQLQSDYGGNKIRFSTRLFSQRALNNYRYRLDKDLPEKNQVHHHLKNQGLLQEVLWMPQQNQSFTARLWFQSADRQIPPTSTQTTSKAAQQDQNIRASLQWNLHQKVFHWQVKTALLDEIIDYQDTLILLYTHNKFRTWLAEAETSFPINRIMNFTGGVYTEIANAQSENYLAGTSRNQSAVFSSVRIHARNWLWRVQMRQEITDNQWSPLLFDIAAEWNAARGLTFKSSVSRNYRMPTLNDLHWRPGGNASLLPEKGFTIEGGANYKSNGTRISFSASLTAYTRKVDQWIMWMPPVKDIRDFWSPINIAKVNSRGVESRSTMSWTNRKWKIDLHTGLDLTWSTFETPLAEFHIEAGDQLFYVPVENGISGISIRYRKLSGFYDHHWFGPSTGINDRIKASSVGSGGVSFGFEGDRLIGLLYVQVENTWNVPYRIIERRPMPGRTFSAGVKFSFD